MGVFLCFFLVNAQCVIVGGCRNVLVMLADVAKNASEAVPA